MKFSLRNDLSTLTTINEQTFVKLSEKIIWCISNCIEEAIKNRENEVEIDTDLGVLVINIDNKNVKYRFVPNKKLENSISNTVINERNDLTVALEESLKTKLTTIYKDFF